jgi:peptidoglycan/LPS O-acetylase OafA/YrhL
MLNLRRITNGESWIPQVDGLRFVAILSVLLFHLSGEIMVRGQRPLHIAPATLPFSHWLANGDRGVALFFLLSGYVLARPFYRMHRLKGRRLPLSEYLLRRLTRLEVPYLLALVIYCVAFHVSFHIPWRLILPHAAASAVYLHNLIYPYSAPFNYVSWSLEVEVQFYLLAPLLGRIFLLQSARRRTLWLAALSLLGCAAGAWFPGPPVTLVAYAGYFPAGFLMAEILENPQRRREQSYLWDAAGLAGWVLLFWLPWGLTLRSFLPLLILPLFLTVFYGKLSSRVLGVRWVAVTGGMCYSIYLMHTLLMSIGFRAIKRITFASDRMTLGVEMALLMAFVLAGSTLYFLAVERPCMDRHWPAELWSRLRGRGHAAAVRS